MVKIIGRTWLMWNHPGKDKPSRWWGASLGGWFIGVSYWPAEPSPAPVKEPGHGA